MTILVGLDGSVHSAATLSFAADFASAMGVDVVIVHCRSKRRGDAELRSEHDIDMAAEEWASVLEEHGVEHELVVMEHDPRHGLIEQAKAERAEVIVIGSRGRGGFRGLKLGGTADHVVHHSRCPVAIVPGIGGKVAGGTAVLGVDGSDANRLAAQWAIHVAERTGGRIEAIFVHDPMADSYPHPMVDNWHYQGQEATERMVKELTDTTDVEVNLSDVAGHVVTTLNSSATFADAAFIVVGTRGRGSVRGRMLGAPVLQLVHHAHRPVVVVPHR